MTIAALSDVTKIPRASIVALEEDRHDALPGPVFVKGFLRCCARALELDGEHVLGLLCEQERARKAEVERLESERLAAERARSERAAARRRVGGKVMPVMPLEPKTQDGQPPARPHLQLATLWAAIARWLRLGDVAGRVPAPRALVWMAVTAILVLAVLGAFAAAGGLRVISPES
ncbi:MAG: helix-turn-helix domain-containing protein [Myxococcales bacterium]|nr:helix-turn-helix domain-containing protein [Myxococcales bacterium]